MAWADEHGIAARLTRVNGEQDRLPLVLCGPILRRTEPDSVTVWVALKQARTVTLRVYSHAPPPFPTTLREELQGTRQTVPLGANLHVVAVTARPVADDRPLAPGTVYFYNLFFGPTGGGVVPETDPDLNTTDVVFLAGGSTLDDPQPTGLSYSFEHRLPSFALPPDDLNKLRIIHGTCRKPDAPGADTLPILDEMIDGTWPLADERPHFLLLNGDQIYADNVADSLIFLLPDVDKALLGWSETQAFPFDPNDMEESLRPPGKRKKIVRKIAGFTTEDPEGHLLSLGEYYAMYLFTWSAVLWPLQFPEFAEVHPHALTGPRRPDSEKRKRRLIARFEKERSTLLTYRIAIRRVRRAMANVPCYMMIDDHDVTDDWNMLRHWCETIYANPLARRIIQNALLAGAVFQAWGNTPEWFSEGQPGEALLTAAAAWSQIHGPDDATPNREQETARLEQEIARLVGIPGTLAANGTLNGLFTDPTEPGRPEDGFFQLARADDALRWHYTIKSPKLDILLLDSRTQRSYTKDKRAPPAHLGPAALKEQIPLDDLDPDKMVLVVSTNNVLTVPLMFGKKVFGNEFICAWWYVAFRIAVDFLQPILEIIKLKPKQEDYNPDLKESWEPQTQPFEALLSRLARRTSVVDGKRRSRVLILSGDVHFSWAARMQYWADRPFEAEDSASEKVETIFAHLSSSPIRKEESSLITLFHNWGYIPMVDSLPGAIRWFGWREASALGVSPQDLGRKPEWVHMPGWMRKRHPPMLAVSEADETHDFIPKPDWRYRIDFLLGEKSGIDFRVDPLSTHEPTDHVNWLKVVAEAQRRHRDYSQKWGDGMEIVGRNNLAELRFQWDGRTGLASNLAIAGASFTVSGPDLLPASPLLVKIGNEIIRVGALDRVTGVCSEVSRAQHGTQAAAHVVGSTVEVFKTVTQTHWWRLTGETKLLPLTRYTVSLDYNDPLFPKPKIPGETDS